MESVCVIFDRSRSAWYKARDAQEQQAMEELVIVAEVERIRQRLPRAGARKLHYRLQSFLEKHRIKLGRDKLIELLRRHNLLIIKQKSKRTTHSYHRFRKYKNIVKEVVPTRPNEIWVSDITYISVSGTYCYLSLITDLYSRKVVGWSLRKDLTAEGPLTALSMAIKQRGKKQPLIHHSDRGIQYCCDKYVKKLKGNKIKISMTENSDPYENAVAERLHRTLKEEFLQYYTYFTHEEAKIAVGRAIKIYNEERPHLSLNYLTPAEAYAKAGTPAASPSFGNPTVSS